MFDFIEGIIVENDAMAGRVVLACGGIGFEVFVVKEVAVDTKAKLYIEETIRDEIRVLYGFEDKITRELFRRLTGVSGVGAASARAILSSLGADRLADAIVSRNDSLLKSVKGIGAKTAQRIIVDLHDKINTGKISLSSCQASSQTYADALAALTTLGYPRTSAEKVLSEVLSSNPQADTQTALRSALKLLRNA